MLFGGAYLAYKFFREIVKRATGVPADAPLIASLFAIGVLGHALGRLAAPAFKRLRPGPMSTPDVLAAIAIPTATVERVYGVSTRDAPIVGAALVSASVLPVARMLVAVAGLIPTALAAVARFGLARPRRTGARRSRASTFANGVPQEVVRGTGEKPHRNAL
jgi:hypothetical protein